MIEYNIRREKGKKYLFIIPLLLFAIDYLLIHFHFIDPIDQIVYQLIQLIKCDVMTEFFKICSFLGSTYFYVGIIIFLLFIKNKKIFYTAGHLLIAQGLNRIIKAIVKRPRPPRRLQLVTETNYSFPSGHSMVSTGFYGLLIYLIYKNVENKKIKYPLIVALSILILLIGISRVYLGAHYATDVIGGWIIGILYLVIFIKYVQNKAT